MLWIAPHNFLSWLLMFDYRRKRLMRKTNPRAKATMPAMRIKATMPAMRAKA